jgi:hypothetical protein
MKTYFSRITADHWTAKNKLEEAAHNLAHEMDRRLIQENELPDYKQEFKDKIDDLNKTFSRCKPLQFSIEKGHFNSNEYAVYCDGVFNMGIYLAKNSIT